MKTEDKDKLIAELEKLVDTADEMDKAFDKLLKGLATDGVALEGFTEAWEKRMAYNHARFNQLIERVSLNDSKKNF